MLKKQQLHEDIETVKRKAPRVLWIIYNILTIGLLLFFVGATINEIIIMLYATPETVRQSELAGQYGRLYNIQGYIVLGVILSIGIILFRLMVSFIRKRYFG